jgi:hypothetical protein
MLSLQMLHMVGIRNRELREHLGNGLLLAFPGHRLSVKKRVACRQMAGKTPRQ